MSLAALLIALVAISYVFPSVFFRRLSAGDLDPTFGHDGLVFTELAKPSEDSCRKVLIQPDGKILAMGRCVRPGRMDFALVRYHDDGGLDRSFGERGVALAYVNESSDVTGVALQPDGKIVVPGNSVQPLTGHDFAIVRFNANGSLDNQFGNGGKVRTDLDREDFAAGVALQPDGKILVVGNSGAPGPRDFALVRYNTDGSLDSRFGNGGKVLTDLGSKGTSDDCAATVAIQRDGKIVVGGFSNRRRPYDFTVVRYNSDGSLDNGSPSDTTPGDEFGSKGIAFADFGGRDEIWALAIQPDGKIVTAGFSWSQDALHMIGRDTLGIKLARFNSDGSLDRSFGNEGKVAPSLSGSPQVFDLALQPDGKIVVPVAFYRAPPGRVEWRDNTTPRPYVTPYTLPRYDIAVIRFNSDGGPDGEFGKGGVNFTNLDPNEQVGPKSVALQRDGKIVVGSTANHQGNWHVVVMRYVSRDQWIPKWW
jgi:uncharacterized delta-60 repeat protein